MRFAVLGPVRVWRDGGEVRLGAVRQRLLLGLLLARAGRPVTVAEAVDALWPPAGTDAGRDAGTASGELSRAASGEVSRAASGAASGAAARRVVALHRHAGALRRVLEPGLPAAAPGELLVRDAGAGADGYRLLVSADSLDLLRFRELVRRARARVTGGPHGTSPARSPGAAVPVFLEALALRAGAVATGMPDAARSHPAFAALEREYLDVVGEAADTLLSAGAYGSAAGQLVAVLRRAVADHPRDGALADRLARVLTATERLPEPGELWVRAAPRRLRIVTDAAPPGSAPEPVAGVPEAAAGWVALGRVRHRLGQYGRAVAGYQCALELFRAVGDGPGEAGVLGHLGDAYLAADDPGSARAVWERAAVLLDRTDPAGAAGLRGRLGALGDAVPAPRLTAVPDDVFPPTPYPTPHP
jgi:tetratricopeptide (TPR) repeat protein